MKVYQKRPVLVKAWQFLLDSEPPKELRCRCRFGLSFAEIPTLEGTMCAYPGDYIIVGVEGEIYPCKERIFLKTYEAVE